MKPNAAHAATQAARWLQQHAGAKYTLVIAADVDETAHDGGHLVVGTFAPNAGIVELLLLATLKKIQAQKAPATIALGGRKGKRGVW